MNADIPVLECVGVTRTYGDVVALRDASLRLHSGDLVAIVGPSGSGKTTLLQTLGTLDRPTSGELFLDGSAAHAMSDSDLSGLRARTIGFVFQQFHLSPLLDITDCVGDGLLYAGWSRRQRRERAREVLESVGLGHRVDHRPHQLSGGERQRVAIARAVVAQPRLLLADEPTGNLDTASGSRVVDLLTGLSDAGVAVVIVTHDVDLAARMPKRITMRDGRIVAREGRI